MNITILTQPEFEPVSLLDCYPHLRLDPDQPGGSHPDDSMILRMIKTARREAEQMTNRSFVRQQLRLSAAHFSHEMHFGYFQPQWHTQLGRFGHGLQLLRPPFIEIESVRYYDALNALQLIDPADYFVTDDLIPQVRLVSPGIWTHSHRSDAIRVDYWTGYPVEGSPDTGRDAQIANVPSEVKDAILIGVQMLYDQLSVDQRDALQKVRESMLSSLKVHALA